MRTVLVDPFEFENFASQESLEVNVARQSGYPHPDLSAFIASVIVPQLRKSIAEPVPFYSIDDRQRVSANLKQFADVDIPLHADWPTYLVEESNWNLTHLIVSMRGAFVRYCWSTSA
jgi:hypothetical protein